MKPAFSSAPNAALDQTLEAYREDKKRFVRGFARFVIGRGHGARRPPKEGEDPRRTPTWQEVGRTLYGEKLFNAVLREELEKAK